TIVGGPTVDSRIGHTAVYAANGQIIVYGGTTPESELTPTPELAVLDTATRPFKWITPPVTTPEVPINPLTNHQANLIGDYMVLITNGPPDLIQQQQLQLLQLQLLQQQQQPQQFQTLQQQLLQQQLLQQLILANQSLPPISNLQQVSNTMDPNLQSRLERSTPSLNNIAIDQTHTNMSTTNQANALAYDQSKVPDSKKYNVIKAKRSNRKAQLDQDATDKASRLAAIQAVNNY
ncbi:14959_t:CDS:2, partial [Entrophospora sp. SA101]